MMARDFESQSLIAMSPLAIGLALVIHGLVYGGKALARLRFFFGRGQPVSLAQELGPDHGGYTKSAAALKEKHPAEFRWHFRNRPARSMAPCIRCFRT